MGTRKVTWINGSSLILCEWSESATIAINIFLIMDLGSAIKVNFSIDLKRKVQVVLVEFEIILELRNLFDMFWMEVHFGSICQDRASCLDH